MPLASNGEEHAAPDCRGGLQGSEVGRLIRTLEQENDSAAPTQDYLAFWDSLLDRAKVYLNTRKAIQTIEAHAANENKISMLHPIGR